jgi:hypothetical protein
MHPGPEGEYSVARWRCPAMADYTIDARFTTTSFGTTDVHVLKKGTILASANLKGIKATHDFFLSKVECWSGEFFEFAVGYGENRTFIADSTFVQVVISN